MVAPCWPEFGAAIWRTARVISWAAWIANPEESKRQAINSLHIEPMLREREESIVVEIHLDFSPRGG